ncbi:hypothetical protein RRG08_065580 [Elysia crispata]|uniref:Uncharacterized protein n=1 Tax=Elysia crispata TaxID=231223 RepID=A0AAE0YN78_9GAST|nr:hypothetical protein RRG08_065580 [Elysia crispata]
MPSGSQPRENSKPHDAVDRRGQIRGNYIVHPTGVVGIAVGNKQGSRVTPALADDQPRRARCTGVLSIPGQSTPPSARSSLSLGSLVRRTGQPVEEQYRASQESPSDSNLRHSGNLIWIVQKQDFGDELEDTCKMNKKELKHKKIVCEGGKGINSEGLRDLTSTSLHGTEFAL